MSYAWDAAKLASINKEGYTMVYSRGVRWVDSNGR